jgi:hypothetical protein
MRFLFPRFPAEFQIPDEWWTEAGMTGFTPSTSAYRSTPEATSVVPLFDIEPPFRLPAVPKDFHGFDRERMIRLLRGIAADVTLPPVGLLILPPLADISAPPFKYRLLCGVHRFYASIAAGFEFLPSATREVCS